MYGNKNWFTKLDKSIKKVTRFADDRHVTSSGKENIFVVIKYGKRASITDILYVPLLLSNLVSMDKLLAKGYNMKFEETMMKMYNG